MYEVLSAYLESRDRQCRPAARVQEALPVPRQAVRAGDPSLLVILVHMMPDMEGKEALGRAIKAEAPWKDRVLVMLTYSPLLLTQAGVSGIPLVWTVHVQPEMSFQVGTDLSLFVLDVRIKISDWTNRGNLFTGNGFMLTYNDKYGLIAAQRRWTQHGQKDPV
jgi:CheY-like chemotaxis protein